MYDIPSERIKLRTFWHLRLTGGMSEAKITPPAAGKLLAVTLEFYAGSELSDQSRVLDQIKPPVRCCDWHCGLTLAPPHPTIWSANIETNFSLTSWRIVWPGNHHHHHHHYYYICSSKHVLLLDIGANHTLDQSGPFIQRTCISHRASVSTIRPSHWSLSDNKKFQ